MFWRSIPFFRSAATATTPVKKPWLNDVQHRKFIRLLERCRVHGSGTPHNVPPTAADMLANPSYLVFSPLFSPFFDFHQQQLTTLGDAIIDKYLSDKLLTYSMHAGLILTTNAAKQWNAIFHNHFALRLFASELQFGELAIPLSHDVHLSEEEASAVEQEHEKSRDPRSGAGQGEDSTGAGPGNPNHSTSAAAARAAMAHCLSRLEARRSGPSRRDVAGTSFASALLPCGQSPLGWKFSHFIGAVHQVFGPAAANTALETLYGLEGDGHLMERAASFLMRVLEVYPAMNVAEAILAAQGLPVSYRGKTRVLGLVETEEKTQQQQHHHQSGGADETQNTPPNAREASEGAPASGTDDDRSTAPSSSSSPSERRDGSTILSSDANVAVASTTATLAAARPLFSSPSVSRHEKEERRRSVALLALSGFGQPLSSSSSSSGSPAQPVTLDALMAIHSDAASASGSAKESLLDGPGGDLDMVKDWQERASNALMHKGDHESARPTPAAPPSDVEAGWLSPEDQWTAQSGPAFANAIDVARHRSFADVYGPPDPENGKVVARIRFKRPVRDPLFYDKLSDMRGGVPLEVEGQGSTEGLLNLLQKPHRRLFEVSMFVGSPVEGRVIGRAIGWRYSVARDAAAKAFLSGVLQDLRRHRLTPSPSSS